MDGEDILDDGRGFWRGNRLRSGKCIATVRARNIPHNARVIGLTIDLDIVVSHKSADLRRPSYRSAGRVYRVGMRFVRVLAAYTGEVRCDHQKKATYYLHWVIQGHGPRILEWFLPEAGIRADQEAALTRVVTDGGTCLRFAPRLFVQEGSAARSRGSQPIGCSAITRFGSSVARRATGRRRPSSRRSARFGSGPPSSATISAARYRDQPLPWSSLSPRGFGPTPPCSRDLAALARTAAAPPGRRAARLDV